MLWLVFTFLLVIGFLAYKWAMQNYNYFKDRGIAHGKPTLLFGTAKDLILGKVSLPEFVLKWYNEFPGEKIVGLFDFRSPYFLIRDPELAKTICIKEFDCFTDHLHSITEDIDPLLGNVLLSLTGKKWRDMRATLSPAFTGSKMRQMFRLMTDTTNASLKTVVNQIKSESENGILEMKDFFSKFTIDIIASCAFGLKVDTFKNPENDFKKVADRTMNPSGFMIVVKFILLSIVPDILKKFDISLLERHTKNFFRSTVIGVMNSRVKEGITRPDMIQLLLEAKKGTLSSDKQKILKKESLVEIEELTTGNAEIPTKWSDDELTAQCLLFFLAGFDTTSTTLMFAAYELAVNPDIQDRLRSEIKALQGRDLTYEVIIGMKYLDQFVTEVLRKWPVSPSIERICVKDCTIDIDGKSVTIPKDYNILVPAYGWHRDPTFFPNPDRFDPLRFDEENIKLQNMNAYAPFGIGPRNCIGSRFALMAVKTILCKMLLNFSFNVTEKTPVPLEFKKVMMTVVVQNGTWVQLKLLKQSG